ncbi:uncharacterized protein Z520_04124 [Fonsecaea multimorphosa CBS 102226]|uniref:DBF4-type domain-containing protein n=1 Tax=Fonsecaea multimorphosa CBS 102226 TaxID=1442371 RepID=A0A0D2KUQ3_9EURO|nr:uncharacterized protein Z520_04124 [Fonsecaea multimorphosa CBS 102226]KIY00439.1 hypothetical protein Z520_04124 [Fonsecaea multimorphosa CBS 102226]OAL26953.1 hypothetical protein AYO22_03897 [Fonsecaea multimorphosa]
MATSSRRVPLASISNATNSPHRPLTNSSSKRPRSIANVSQQENEPPHKRLAIDRTGREVFNPATPQKQSHPPLPEGRVFERGHGESASTAFQRRLVAARDRDRTAGLRVTKNVDTLPKEDTAEFKAWQRHYRKLFPSFRFYFDGFPEDVKSRFLRHITALGAKEEKFFSKAVTHIVTARHIPAELAKNTSPGEESAQTSPTEDQPQTINPSLLEKNPRGSAGPNVTRTTVNPMDILVRGKEMGMKIYSIDKLQRVLNSILDDAANHGHHTRASAHTTRHQREDLGEVLRNEKLGVASERELPFMSLVAFKGPFIYVHDMDEKHRPTLVREYPKVARRADGEWPQFRSASVGKCPFVEDPAMKKDIEQEQKRAQKLALQQEQQRQQQQRREQHVPRTRSHVTVAAAGHDAPRRASPRKALQTVDNGANASVDLEKEKESKSHSLVMERQPSFPPMPRRGDLEFVRPPQLHMAREPAASGIQRSNLTSAIQSQVISSTAATGAKAGTSKEVHHQLQRQVLERTHTGSLSVGSIPSSHRMNDLAGVLKNARGTAPQRAAKSKAQEKLGGIQEEADSHADDIAAERATHTSRKKKSVKKEAKPGYCENCRDKYDDFDEHIVSRKHRKFAMTQSNWTELDALLAKLQAS